MRKIRVLFLFDNAKFYKDKFYEKYLEKNLEIFELSDNFDYGKIDAIVVFHKKPLLEIDLKKFKNLKIIQTLTAGTEHIPSFIKENYEVCGNSGANSRYIAEHAFGLMLACAKKICYHTEKIKKGYFLQKGHISKKLYHSNLLLLGFGAIGKEVAKIGYYGFSMNIKVFRKRKILEEEYKGIVQEVINDKNRLKKVFPWADYIVICMPLTEETRDFITREELKLMKNDAVLVNIARGKIINEKDLYEHLLENPNFYAGLDVWFKYPKDENEKFSQNYPFEKLENVVMTPHIAPMVKNFFDNMVENALNKIMEKIG